MASVILYAIIYKKRCYTKHKHLSHAHSAYCTDKAPHRSLSLRSLRFVCFATQLFFRLPDVGAWSRSISCFVGASMLIIDFLKRN